MEQLIEELKTKVIEALNLEDMSPADLDANAPLFGNDGIGLDSIDALELIVMLEKSYGIKITDPSEGKKVFGSIAIMAQYVSENRKN